jgi:hypothetical protein
MRCFVFLSTFAAQEEVGDGGAHIASAAAAPGGEDGRFFESVGNFFTGGDNIPWCDRDIIAVSTRELPPLSASI